MRRLIKFARKPAAEQWLVLEAAAWLGCIRLAIAWLPFRWLAFYLGQHMVESPEEISAASRERSLMVARVVERLGRHLPWECTCLVQAVAAMALLKRRGQQSTLYLGVAREGVDRLCAHAWLRTGDIWVTGGSGHDRFAVVGCFAQHG